MLTSPRRPFFSCCVFSLLAKHFFLCMRNIYIPRPECRWWISIHFTVHLHNLLFFCLFPDFPRRSFHTLACCSFRPSFCFYLRYASSTLFFPHSILLACCHWCWRKKRENSPESIETQKLMPNSTNPVSFLSSHRGILKAKAKKPTEIWSSNFFRENALHDPLTDNDTTNVKNTTETMMSSRKSLFSHWVVSFFFGCSHIQNHQHKHMHGTVVRFRNYVAVHNLTTDSRLVLFTPKRIARADTSFVSFWHTRNLEQNKNSCCQIKCQGTYVFYRYQKLLKRDETHSNDSLNRCRSLCCSKFRARWKITYNK